MSLSKKEDNRVLFNLSYTSIYGAESSFLQIPDNILSVVLSKNTKLFFFSCPQFEKTDNIRKKFDWDNFREWDNIKILSPFYVLSFCAPGNEILFISIFRSYHFDIVTTTQSL
mmetsp:Transcript_1155/g.1887  ORF Transcript_1155/g.1887 Transcript_1155/m.1887 type:complete len:113 (-) Transcript_1155:1543-1881(-)